MRSALSLVNTISRTRGLSGTNYYIRCDTFSVLLGDHFGLDASDFLAGGGLGLGPGLGLLLAAGAAPLLLGGGLDHRVEGLVDIHGARTRVRTNARERRSEGVKNTLHVFEI